ncbi:Pirin [Cynara cardunculus var. scolymus]|uniref:Pirin n=1 Tax=Cynara cardunculus var. scolymus TaxID=59895 RepID=A0A103YJW0_CYNCS|nr:Pirin [Cynara cardunculus var. scolymus]
MPSHSRTVLRKFLARPQHEGAGAVVRRSIGRFELKYFDPFLVLDEFCVSSPGGFPDHPHRGFETVTYMLQMASTNIAEGIEDGVRVRVIAGESLGIKSPIYTRTPTMFLDFTLEPGAHVHQPVPESWNAFVYVLEGEGMFGNSKASSTTPHHLLLLGPGDGLESWNKSSKPLRFILVGGEPLGQPVVQWGPFVMNTQEEIDQTIQDYENFENGFEKARYWRSEALN